MQYPAVFVVLARYSAPVVATLALLLMAIMAVTPAHAAREPESVPDIQACTSHEQCTLVRAGCAASCDMLPVNRDYAAEVLQSREEICGADDQSQRPCQTAPELGAACINEHCTVSEVYQERSSWGDYKRPGDEGWTWTSQMDGWGDSGFTAYDMPQEMVKQGRLELRRH